MSSHLLQSLNNSPSRCPPTSWPVGGACVTTPTPHHPIAAVQSISLKWGPTPPGSRHPPTTFILLSGPFLPPPTFRPSLIQTTLKAQHYPFPFFTQLMIPLLNQVKIVSHRHLGNMLFTKATLPYLYKK